MPLYDYHCQSCEHEFEAVVTGRTTNADSVHCPKCDGTQLERLLALPARGRVAENNATNCRGDGPPCGAPWCGRKP